MRKNPRFQKHILNAVLNRGDAFAVMMGVDEARQHRHALRADDFRLWIALVQHSPVVEGDHFVILDEDRTVHQHRIVGTGNDPPASIELYRVH